MIMEPIPHGALHDHEKHFHLSRETGIQGYLFKLPNYITSHLTGRPHGPLLSDFFFSCGVASLEVVFFVSAGAATAPTGFFSAPLVSAAGASFFALPSSHADLETAS